MKNLWAVFWAMVSLTLPISGWVEGEQLIVERIGEIKHIVCEDYKNFYSGENLGKLTIGIAVAGALANTSADRRIQDWYQESLRSKETDSFSRSVKPFGEGMIIVPVYVGAALLGELTRSKKLGSTTGEWGRKSLRTLSLGAPLLLLLQKALGASRPEEANSHWHPFQGDNSVSGHSFMGAIPFITAAKMTNNPYLGHCLYLASVLCGLSRINDDAHYLSQATLGWWMAYLAATSVQKTETSKQQVVITPDLNPNRVGMVVALRFR
jgi:hypothetical protein